MFSVMRVSNASTLLRLDDKGNSRPMAVAQNCTDTVDTANVMCHVFAECLNAGFDTIEEVRAALLSYREGKAQ